MAASIFVALHNGSLNAPPDELALLRCSGPPCSHDRYETNGRWHAIGGDFQRSALLCDPDSP
jgi:hypothetical protein